MIYQPSPLLLAPWLLQLSSLALEKEWVSVLASGWSEWSVAGSHRWGLWSDCGLAARCELVMTLPGGSVDRWAAAPGSVAGSGRVWKAPSNRIAMGRLWGFCLDCWLRPAAIDVMAGGSILLILLPIPDGCNDLILIDQRYFSGNYFSLIGNFLSDFTSAVLH